MPALVIAAHGSHRNADAAIPAFEHGDAIRDTDAFDEVRVSFWKEEPHYRDTLRTIAADEVFLVPLFISEGYFTEQVIPREFRLEGWDPSLWDSDGTAASAVTLEATDTGQTVHYCGPVGTHDALTAVIEQRAMSITGERSPSALTLAVVGHGTKRNEHSAMAIRYHVDRLRHRDAFATVEARFLDEPPHIETLPEGASAPVVVVPLFVADGYHTREDIPEDLGIVDAGDWSVPATVEDTTIWYSGAVGTEPLVARVILERARDAGAAVDDGLEQLPQTGGGPS